MNARIVLSCLMYYEGFDYCLNWQLQRINIQKLARRAYKSLQIPKFPNAIQMAIISAPCALLEFFSRTRFCIVLAYTNYLVSCLKMMLIKVANLIVLLLNFKSFIGHVKHIELLSFDFVSLLISESLKLLAFILPNSDYPSIICRLLRLFYTFFLIRALCF